MSYFDYAIGNIGGLIFITIFIVKIFFKFLPLKSI